MSPVTSDVFRASMKGETRSLLISSAFASGLAARYWPTACSQGHMTTATSWR